MARVPTVAERLREIADPTTSVTRLVKLAQDGNNTVLVALGESARPEAREAAAHSPHELARIVLAQQHGLSADLLDLLVSDESAPVRRQLCYHVCDPATFARLVADPHHEVRRETLRNPQATVALAHALAVDADHRVRMVVPFSELADLDLLDLLAEDRRGPVRNCVASSRRSRPETLTRLAGDRSADVRWSVLVNNPDRPDVVALLVDDPDQIVRQQARARLAHPEQFGRFLRPAQQLL